MNRFYQCDVCEQLCVWSTFLGAFVHYTVGTLDGYDHAAMAREDHYPLYRG